jgi:hypothetical protein
MRNTLMVKADIYAMIRASAQPPTVDLAVRPD